MDFASWRKPGPIETSFSALLQRAMRGKLFPDIIHHYERVELETRAMIVADWLMTFYTEVLFRFRGDSDSRSATDRRIRDEFDQRAQQSQRDVMQLQLTAAQSLKDHFNWALHRAQQHSERREDDYAKFLQQRREIGKRFEAAKLLQRVGRGKLWRVLLHISQLTRNDGLTTKSQHWEATFNKLLRARRLIANAAYKKQVTDSAVEYARRGASDDRTSLSTAKKMYQKFQELLQSMSPQKNPTSPALGEATASPSSSSADQPPAPPSPVSALSKHELLPFRLQPAPWNWTVRRAELEQRARLVLEFVIAEERLDLWRIWKLHIRDLVLKQAAIPASRVDHEVRRVWRTIEIESIALSQRAQMHKEFLKSLADKFQQYRQDRAELKEALIRKGVLFPDQGCWDFDLPEDDPNFNANDDDLNVDPFSIATLRQSKADYDSKKEGEDDEEGEEGDDFGETASTTDGANSFDSFRPIWNQNRRGGKNDGSENDEDGRGLSEEDENEDVDEEEDDDDGDTKSPVSQGRSIIVSRNNKKRVVGSEISSMAGAEAASNCDQTVATTADTSDNNQNNNNHDTSIITSPTKTPGKSARNQKSDQFYPRSSIFGNLGQTFLNRPSSATSNNSRPASETTATTTTITNQNNNDNLHRQDSLIPAGTNPFSRPGSGSQNNNNLNNFSNGRNGGRFQFNNINSDETNLMAQDSVFAEILEQKRRKEEREKWKRFERGGDNEDDNNNKNNNEEEGDEEEDEDNDRGSQGSSMDSKISIRAKKQGWI